MTDFIFDAETMGQNIFTCPIVNFAIYKFERKRFIDDPYTYDEILSGVKLLKLNVIEQVKKHKYIIEPNTLQFWKNLPADVQKQIQPKADDLSLQEFCDQLLSYIGNSTIRYWWSRSNTFDPVLLYRIARDSGNIEQINKALKFWRVRDIRTFIDAKTDFELEENAFIPIDPAIWKTKFKEHDCMHDITADVLRMQVLTRAENGLK